MIPVLNIWCKLWMHLTHAPYEMIEPHPYSPQGLQDKYDPLATEIRNTGITVYSAS